jgi:hypothetical protein
MSSVVSQVLSDNSTRYIGAKGSAVLTRLKPGAVLMTAVGWDDGSLGDRFLEALDEEIAKTGSVVAFVDSRATRGVTSEVRERVGRWTKEHRPQFRACHLLFSSKLVEMTVAVVNLMTGGFFRTYSDVATFERAIARDVPGFVHLPVFDTAPSDAAAKTRE